MSAPNSGAWWTAVRTPASQTGLEQIQKLKAMDEARKREQERRPAEPGRLLSHMGDFTSEPKDTIEVCPKVREAIKLIEADGWPKVTTKGSHRQFKHPMKTERVTIAGRLSDGLASGTYNSILKQAGLKES